MEDKATLSDRILSILATSSTNETPLSEILSATNVPKKTLNAELQKLKRKGVIVKTQDTPPIWSLKESNKFSQETVTGKRLTRSKAQVDKEVDGGKQHSKKSVDEKFAESKSASLMMNKDLGKRIVSYLQSQRRAVKTVDIAKAVGCKTPKEINPTLYAMKRKNIVVKVIESPPTWSVSSEIPPDFLQQEEADLQPNVFIQSQQNIMVAGPVQYPMDGSIPAFQETSLFNSDVSFETDYSGLLTGGDNVRFAGGDPSLTGGDNPSSVSDDPFNIAAGDPLNRNRGLFDEDPQNDSTTQELNITEYDPVNTNRGLFDDDPQNDTSSQEFDNEEGDSDKMCVNESEKPSAFRSFFKLDEPVSDESEDDMNEADQSAVDSGNNFDETNDTLGDSVDESNDRINEFSDSNEMIDLPANNNEHFKANETNGDNNMIATHLTHDMTAFIKESVDRDLSPPVLDKQEMNVKGQFHENEIFEEDGVDRHFNETKFNRTEVVFPNELPEELPVEIEEIAPNELPDQLPLDQDSDDNAGDAMDQDIYYENVNVREIQEESQVEMKTGLEKNDLNETLDFESKNKVPVGDNQMKVTENRGQKASLLDLKAENVHMHDDENKNNNSIPCNVPLNDECQQLLKVFNPDMPCAQFVLKNKSKLSPDKFTECLQELEEQNIVEKKGNQWQLTENGKVQYRSILGSDSSHSDHAMPLPRKRPHSSGPPPSPMALIQKEKGLKPETSKESPLAFLRGAPKVDPFKQTVNLIHNRVCSSGHSETQSNVEHLNSDLFPGARTVTTSSYALISTSPISRPTQSTVTSAFAGRPANNPVPLMSLNLDKRQTPGSAVSSLNSAGQQSETNTFVDKTLSGTGLFQQETRPSFNQTSSLFQQETASYNQSSRPSGQSVNGLFTSPLTSMSALVQSSSSLTSTTVRPSVTQTSSAMGPPVTKPKVKSDKLVIPKPPPRPGAILSGKPSASSQKPPMSPAEMLARGLKKTEISPPKTMDSSPVSLLSSSHSVQLNASQRSVTGNQSMFNPPVGPQSLMTANQTGSQLSKGNFQSSGNQSGMLSSNQTGIRSLMSQPQSLGNQSGYKPQTMSQGQFGLSSLSTQSQGLGRQSGFKPLNQLQTSSVSQFGSLSHQPQSTPAVKIPQPQPSSQPLSLDTESFAALNKNPVSALMEYAQSRKMEARIELIGRRGASHRPTFEMAAFVGRRQFPSVHCSNKKDGKKEACDIALRQLIAEGQFHQAAQSPKPTVAPSNMTHFDKMAALTHRGFTALVSQIRSESFAGRKVIAGLVMKRSETDTGILVSLGTGNRCITGQQLSLEGNTINDSHAEIITRRGFIRFLYKQLWEYSPHKPSPLFERSPRGKIQIRPNITFHLYISTAPCGDGALFSPRDEAANKAAVDMQIRPPHNPTFSSNVQGLLRTKVEGGEGTIPIEPGFKGLTFDGVQRGERLLTMSCTDKVCRWNVVGLQGALLSNFLEPIYLDSLTLGLLYDHGHLARAVCCRVGKGDTDVDSLLPPGYRLNHPWLGRVTVCDPPREVQKTKALSVNWCFGDNAPEVVDGTLGLNLTSIEKQMFSRCSKRNLYNSFKKLCEKFDRKDLLSAQTYREAKDMATDFKTAKEAMLKKFKENKYGKWVSKPIEEEMFS